MKIAISKVKRSIFITTLAITLLFLTVVVDAASVNGFVFSKNGESLEFARGTLAGQYILGGPMYTEYTSFGTAPEFFKMNGFYYKRSTLASKYISLPAEQKSLDNALAITTTQNLLTKIAKIYNNAENIYEGPELVNANSSLKLYRLPNNTDGTEWVCVETDVSPDINNPIGPIKFIFSKDFAKQDLSKVNVYLNGVLPSTDDADIIKDLLFGEFVTRAVDSTSTNTLDGNIAFSYIQLKDALALYNSSSVNEVKIEVTANDNSIMQMILHFSN